MTKRPVEVVEWRGGAPIVGNGRWRAIVLDNVLTAEISCPGCGRCGRLSDHAIAADGIVSPSVVCTACPFHAWIKLVGWTA